MPFFITSNGTAIALTKRFPQKIQFYEFLQSVFLQGKILADLDHRSLLFTTAIALRHYRFSFYCNKKMHSLTTGGVVQSG
jgi:hypothetical protein